MPVPVGVGILIAGGNDNNIRGNRIYDNWRRGTMLIEVPDSLLEGDEHDRELDLPPQPLPQQRDGNRTDGTKMPNGVDFWWDEAPDQKNNCWYDNGEVTTDPPGPLMPSDCSNTSAGVTYPGKFASELGPCAAAIEGDQYDATTCPWFRTPDKPSSGREQRRACSACRSQASGAPKLTLLTGNCRLVGTTLSCDGFSTGPSRRGSRCWSRAAAGQPASPEPFGVALQVADCQDWRESSPQERQSAVDQLKETVAGPRKEGNTLPDDVAYSTLDARCKPDFAHGFLLYQLYIRAAAFTPSTE